jgi:hypothetical protein
MAIMVTITINIFPIVPEKLRFTKLSSKPLNDQSSAEFAVALKLSATFGKFRPPNTVLFF